MALEAINKVKAAEDQATKIITDATVQSKNILKNAEEQSKIQYDSIINDAHKKGEEIKAKFLKDSEEKSEPILEKGKEAIESILNIDNSKFQGAVKLVIERIVNFNGDS